MQNGACLSCYGGYALNAATGQCAVSSQDSNCKETRPDGSCASCSNRFYIGANGKCTAVNPLCRDYNRNNGACTICYNGYRVSGNTCVPGSSGDINCKSLS